MKPEPAKPSPKDLGYYFPAEFEPHTATWLSWPHKEASWPGKIQAIYGPYAEFIAALSRRERVCINVSDESMKAFALEKLSGKNARAENVCFYFNPTNDAWCRDHGPAFLVNPKAAQPKMIVDWGFNAWGGKYPPYELDDTVPTRIAETLGLPVVHPGIVMEGGSVDFNGRGTVITSESCLLNPNRNPSLGREEIESFLRAYYGQDQVLWVKDGILGDDTDGHVDDTVRFVNADTVVVAVEPNKADENHAILERNRKDLSKMRLSDGRQLNLVELPMPGDLYHEGQRLPASYANFYIANGLVVVPVFGTDRDDEALRILASVFPDREVIGLNSLDIIWGLGSFHCLSQQEPQVPSIG